MSAKLEGYLEKFHHDEFGDLAVFMSDMHSIAKYDIKFASHFILGSGCNIL